jgi:hypothetical protein
MVAAGEIMQEKNSIAASPKSALPSDLVVGVNGKFHFQN